MTIQSIFGGQWKIYIYKASRCYSTKGPGNITNEAFRLLNPNPYRPSFETTARREQPSRNIKSTIVADNSYKQELLKANLWWGYYPRYHCNNERYEYMKSPEIEKLEFPHRDGTSLDLSQLKNRIRLKGSLKWPLTLMEKYLHKYGKEVVSGHIPTRVQLISRLTKLSSKKDRRLSISGSSIREVEKLIGFSRTMLTSRELFKLQDTDSKIARDFACLRTERAFGSSKI